MKKILAVALLCMTIVLSCGTALAAPDTGDLLRFIPTVVTVSNSKVAVEGYFVNLDPRYYIQNLRDVDMDVYVDGELLVSAYFGELSQFTINPLGVKHRTLNFNGSYGLANGTYYCDDSYYTKFDCRFTVVEK